MATKSILIRGTRDAGKSTTMAAVCRELNPTKVYRLDISNALLKPAEISEIYNNTFIIEVHGKLILVIAGAPTEQGYTLTAIVEICIILKIEISFLLVSMRSFETKKGFNTLTELEVVSEIILNEQIYQVEDEDFKNNNDWKKRIKQITEKVKECI